MSPIILLAMRVRIPLWMALLIFAIAGFVLLVFGIVSIFSPRRLLNTEGDGWLAFFGGVARSFPSGQQEIGARFVGMIMVVLAFLLAAFPWWFFVYRPMKEEQEQREYIAKLFGEYEEDRESDEFLRAMMEETDPGEVVPEKEVAVENLPAAEAYLSEARTLWQNGDLNGSVEAAEKALRIYTHHLGENDPKTVSCAKMLASAREQAGQ